MRNSARQYLPVKRSIEGLGQPSLGDKENGSEKTSNHSGNVHVGIVRPRKGTCPQQGSCSRRLMSNRISPHKSAWRLESHNRGRCADRRRNRRLSLAVSGGMQEISQKVLCHLGGELLVRCAAQFLPYGDLRQLADLNQRGHGQQRKEDRFSRIFVLNPYAVR